MSTPSFSVQPRAVAFPALKWVAVATIVIAFILPTLVPLAFIYTVPLGVIGIACAFYGATHRAKMWLIIGNFAAMIAPVLVPAGAMLFLTIATFVTGGHWPPPDFG